MGKTSTSRRALSALASVVTAALLITGMTTLGATGAAAADTPSTPPPLLQRNDDVVTSDPIPTVQIDNGYVWSQTTIGSPGPTSPRTTSTRVSCPRSLRR